MRGEGRKRSTAPPGWDDDLADPVVTTRRGERRLPTPSRRSRRWAAALAAVLVATAAVVGPGSVTAQDGLPTPEPYRVAGTVGGGDVHAFGKASYQGSLADTANIADVAGLAAHPGGSGYWIATADGAVHAFGAANDLGGVAHLALDAPIVDIVAHPDGRGYWLAGADGGVFAFGSAGFRGAMAGVRLDSPVVAMAVAPDGHGYWLAAADGGLFAFGSAGYHGSMGGTALVEPITAMVATSSGRGYYLFAGDGGVFTFGDAVFRGSLGDLALHEQIVDADATPDGRGYWLAGDRGGVFTFGSLGFHGSAVAGADEPVVAIAARPDGDGYWLATTPGPESVGVPLPDGSGTGRRIVYSNSMQRVWLVEENGSITDSYLVSGRQNVPRPGTYEVFSKSPLAWAGHHGITMEYMVRFAHGRRLAIGFHGIPVRPNGTPLQSEDQLGTYRSAGCVRQRLDKAQQLYDWAPIGTKVVVLA